MTQSPERPSDRILRRLRIGILVAGALLLVVVAWRAVRQPYPQADWIRVESHRKAIMNQRLPLRVTLTTNHGVGYLVADLHGSGPRRQPLGYLSSSLPASLPPAGGTFDLEIPVPLVPDLEHVRAIIFLVRTPRWQDRVRFVETAELSVEPPGTRLNDSALRPWHAHERYSDPEVIFRETRWSRPLIGGLWLMAAVVAWRRPGPAALGWMRHWLAAACVLAGAVEFASLDVHLTNVLRTWAQRSHWYHDRRSFQQFATLAGLAVTAGATWLAWSRIRGLRRSLAALGLGLFLALSLSRLFSQHEVDQLLAILIGPLTLVQFAKLTAALLVIGVLWPHRRPPRSHTATSEPNRPVV